MPSHCKELREWSETTFDCIDKAIEEYTANLVDSDDAVADKPITLQIDHTRLPNLTLIDLPGRNLALWPISMYSIADLLLSSRSKL